MDVIVAGVDQVSARSYINEYSIKTLTPYIDAGSIIKTDDEDGVTSMHGYIQTVVPGVSACFDCLDRGDPDRERLERMNQNELEEQVDRGYVDESVLSPEPAVIHLNSSVASKAVSELSKLVTGFDAPVRFLRLEDKARECRKSTVDSHRSRLGFFVEWCADQGIDNLNYLSARDLHEFRVWRREDLSVNTEKTQMDTLRVFLWWCETIDAVPGGLSRKVRSPTIPDEKVAKETTLHVSEAEEIVEYLHRFEYASIEHIAWLILSETGMRMGAVRALDVRDYRPNAEQPYLDVVHRPETDTPIKNGPKGERRVGISDDVCAVVDDYLEHQRPDTTDEHGREPLLATDQGRVATSTIRRYVYRWSRPCAIGRECPHDRDPDECEAVVDTDRASGCPSSVTPHPIRRGYITHLLQAGVPVDVVSDRCNVSPKVIDRHYDVRTEEDKMRQRREVLDEILRDGSGDR